MDYPKFIVYTNRNNTLVFKERNQMNMLNGTFGNGKATVPTQSISPTLLNDLQLFENIQVQHMGHTIDLKLKFYLPYEPWHEINNHRILEQLAKALIRLRICAG